LTKILTARIIRGNGREFWCGAMRGKATLESIRMEIFIFNSRTNIVRFSWDGNPIWVTFYHGDPL